MAKQIEDHFEVPADEIEGAILSYLEDCDADEIARIAETIFGGQCTTDGKVYDFYPDKDYSETFGEYTDPTPWLKEKVRSLKQIRHYIRKLAELPNCRAIRIIVFDMDDNEVLTINDIYEAQAEPIRKGYAYGSGIDRMAQIIADRKLMSIETVIIEGYDNGK